MRRKLGVQAVESFIRNQLPKKLAKDLLDHRIIMEADIEACAYYHLRRYLRPDAEWRILVERFVPHTGYRVDIILFRKTFPRIALELKWNRDHMSDKDRNSLSRSIDTLGVNKAYFLATCLRTTKYRKIRKTEVEKNRVFEVIISPGLSKDELIKWKAKRHLFKKDMSYGKALKHRRAA